MGLWNTCVMTFKFPENDEALTSSEVFKINIKLIYKYKPRTNFKIV